MLLSCTRPRAPTEVLAKQRRTRWIRTVWSRLLCPAQSPRLLRRPACSLRISLSSRLHPPGVVARVILASVSPRRSVDLPLLSFFLLLLSFNNEGEGERERPPLFPCPTSHSSPMESLLSNPAPPTPDLYNKAILRFLPILLLLLLLVLHHLLHCCLIAPGVLLLLRS